MTQFRADYAKQTAAFWRRLATTTTDHRTALLALRTAAKWDVAADGRGETYRAAERSERATQAHRRSVGLI